MNRKLIESLIEGNTEGLSDYENYLNTGKLLGCQKKIHDLANQDEMMFQIVHQSIELWMKLVSFSLMQIHELLPTRNTFKIQTLFKRVSHVMNLMIQGLETLETISPHDYQKIRLLLGNGSGQESPGFKSLMELASPLWIAFKSFYLEQKNITLESVYVSNYNHEETYVVAEALVEYDELFQKFRYYHLQLVARSIGLGAKSLKGRNLQGLLNGLTEPFFPELWDVRSEMTAKWGQTYGNKRDSTVNPEPTPGCPFAKSKK